MSKGMSEIMSKGIIKAQNKEQNEGLNKVQNKEQNEGLNKEQFMQDKDEYRYTPLHLYHQNFRNRTYADS